MTRILVDEEKIAEMRLAEAEEGEAVVEEEVGEVEFLPPIDRDWETI